MLKNHGVIIDVQYKLLATTPNILLFIIDHGGMNILHYNGTATDFVVYSVPAFIQKHLSLFNFSKWRENNLKIKVLRNWDDQNKVNTVYTMKWVVITMEYIFCIPPWLIIKSNITRK